jgi:hypothetical protein
VPEDGSEKVRYEASTRVLGVGIVLAVVIPILGFIYGIVLMSKGDKRGALPTFLAVVATFLIAAILHH